MGKGRGRGTRLGQGERVRKRLNGSRWREGKKKGGKKQKNEKDKARVGQREKHPGAKLRLMGGGQEGEAGSKCWAGAVQSPCINQKKGI